MFCNFMYNELMNENIYDYSLLLYVCFRYYLQVMSIDFHNLSRHLLQFWKTFLHQRNVLLLCKRVQESLFCGLFHMSEFSA